MNKAEINDLLAEIKKRKKCILYATLENATAKLADPKAVKEILDANGEAEETLARLEATAELILSRYHKKSVKGRALLSPEELK